MPKQHWRSLITDCPNKYRNDESFQMLLENATNKTRSTQGGTDLQSVKKIHHLWKCSKQRWTHAGSGRAAWQVANMFSQQDWKPHKGQEGVSTWFAASPKRWDGLAPAMGGGGVVKAASRCCVGAPGPRFWGESSCKRP